MRSKQLKTVVACVVSAICAIGLFADGEKVATWKGSVSSAWNNPANWVEGVVPGRYITKDANNNTITNGEYGWTARFERSDARWVVEFMGQIVSISNLVFSGASGTTKVGTGASHVLFLEDGGGIYIEESHANHLSIDGSIGIAGQRDANAIYHIRNDSPKTLRVKGAFTNFRMDGVWGTPHMRFEGKGKSWLYGGFPGNSGFRPNLDVAMDEGGELHITNTVNNFKTLYAPSGFPKQHIVIEPGSALVPVQESQCQIEAKSSLEISGEGQVRFRMANKGNSGTGYLYAGNGVTLTISAPVSQLYTGAEAVFLVNSGRGTVRFTGVNTIPQNLNVRVSTVEANTIGMAGEPGNIGLGSKIIIEQGGALRYTGSGETTDRVIEIGYYTNVLEQAGTGPVIFTGNVTSLNWQATLVLSNDTDVAATYAGAIVSGAQQPIVRKRGTGPVIFTGCVTSLAYQATLVLSNDTDVAATYAGAIVSGVQHPIIRKRGTGEWILSGANTTQEMFYHEGGTLTVGSASSLPRLTVAGGGTLKIADGVTLTLPTTRFIYNSGTLDVVPGAGSKFIVSDAVRGPAPEWLTINGRPAKYKANGELAMANLGIVIIFR